MAVSSVQFAKSGPYVAQWRDGERAEITHRSDPSHVIERIAVDNAEHLQTALHEWHNRVRENYR